MGEKVLTAHEEIVANSISYQIMGEVMAYLNHADTIPSIIQKTETEAVKTLEKIRQILNDDSLEDPQCFMRIDAIVSALGDHGIYTNRHDF